MNGIISLHTTTDTIEVQTINISKMFGTGN